MPQLICDLPAAQIIFIGMNVLCGRFSQRTLLVLAQNHAQRTDNVVGNLILDGKDILELPIVAFRL